MHRTLSSFLSESRAPTVVLGTILAFIIALVGVLRLGLPIWSLLIVAFAIAYAFLTLHEPRVGLLAIICVFFIPLRFSFGLSLLHVVGVATAVLLLVWFMLQRRPMVFATIQIPLMALGMLILVSVWFSPDPQGTVFYLLRWFFNMMFVMLLLNLVTTFGALKSVLWAVMIMAAVNSAVGIFEYVFSSDYNYRSIGLMENANNFGHLAALAFPLALYQYLYRRGAIRWFGLALACLLMGGVVASVSRGALLSVIIVSGATLALERRRAIPILLIIVLALSVAPFLPDFFQERVGNLAEDVKNSLMVGSNRELTSRGYLNSAGLRIWSTHPVLGVGIGNFGHYYVQREYVEGLAGTEQTIAHNIYIQALAETGLVGAAILMWLLLNSVRNVWRGRRVYDRSSQEWIYFSSLSMMTFAILISTATYGSLMDNDFWMFLGLTAVAGRIASRTAHGSAKVAAEA